MAAFKIYDGTNWVELLKSSDISSWAKANTKPTYTASEVGAAASSHTHAFSSITSRGEALLAWGGQSLSGNVTPIGMALSNEHSGNKLAFINGDCLTFEYSSDGGSTWTDYGYSASVKSQFCTQSYGVPIGRTSGNYTTNSRTRITITAQNGTTGYVYTDPKKLLINVSSSGGMNVLIEYRSGTNYKNNGAWTTFGTYALSGWSGWNDIPLILGTLGGGTTQTSNNWQLRLTFIMTSVNSSYPTTASVQAIRLYGANSWTVPSTMASTGHLYTFDMSKNATFPASVYATALYGTTIYENGTALSSKYLGLSSKAADSSKLNGQAASYYAKATDISNATITIKQTGLSDQTFTLNGSATTITLADNNTTYSNGTGLTLSNNQFSISAANASTILNLLSTGSSTPVDADYYISQYVGGGTTTTSYHRRPMSALWSYVKGKADSVYQAKGTYAGTSVASQSANGLMSSTDKKRLDDIYTALNGTNSTKIDTLAEVYAFLDDYAQTTDLAAQLGTKVTANTAITGNTKCKVTYDSKGLVTSGSDLAASDIPNLGAGKITSGTFDAARIPSLSADKITSGTFDAARIPSLSADKIGSGTLAIARLPTGTGSNQVALGNHTHSQYAELNTRATFSELGIVGQEYNNSTGSFIDFNAGQGSVFICAGAHIDVDETLIEVPLTNHDETLAYQSWVESQNYLTAHPTITAQTNTTSSVSPSHGSSFTVIDSITKDANGHITKYNTKTVTLPAAGGSTVVNNVQFDSNSYLGRYEGSGPIGLWVNGQDEQIVLGFTNYTGSDNQLFIGAGVINLEFGDSSEYVGYYHHRIRLETGGYTWAEMILDGGCALNISSFNDGATISEHPLCVNHKPVNINNYEHNIRILYNGQVCCTFTLTTDYAYAYGTATLPYALYKFGYRSVDTAKHATGTINYSTSQTSIITGVYCSSSSTSGTTMYFCYDSIMYTSSSTGNILTAPNTSYIGSTSKNISSYTISDYVRDLGV